MKISIRARDQKTQKSIRELSANLSAEIDRRLDRGARTFARSAKGFAPKAFSTLTNSIHSKKAGELRYEISTAANYALAVHEGRAPGSLPPLQHIIEWIKVKGITPRNADFSTRDLAWVIAKSIEKNGTKAQPFMQQADDAVGNKIKRSIDAGVQSAFAKAAPQ